MTQFDIGHNELTGDLPSQLGRLSLIESAADSGFLSGNEHDGATIPTELGGVTGMTFGGFFLYNSKLGGTMPTELGRVVAMRTRFQVNINKLSGTIPTREEQWRASPSAHPTTHPSLLS